MRFSLLSQESCEMVDASEPCEVVDIIEPSSYLKTHTHENNICVSRNLRNCV